MISINLKRLNKSNFLRPLSTPADDCVVEFQSVLEGKINKWVLIDHDYNLPNDDGGRNQLMNGTPPFAMMCRNNHRQNRKATTDKLHNGQSKKPYKSNLRLTHHRHHTVERSNVYSKTFVTYEIKEQVFI